MKTTILVTIYSIILISVYSCSSGNTNNPNESNILTPKAIVYVDTNSYIPNESQKTLDSLKELVDGSILKVRNAIITAEARIEKENREYEQQLIEREKERQFRKDSIRLVREAEENQPMICYVNRRQITLSKKLFNLLYKSTKKNPCIDYSTSCYNCNSTGWASDNVLALKTGNVNSVYTCDACYGKGHICQ